MQATQAIWLVMGVSGSGKTSLACALAQASDGAWLDADDFHPLRNVERMRQGHPLCDDDRWPWLAAVAEAANRLQPRTAGPVFVACSALKRRYRDFLRDRLPGMQVLYLEGPEALIYERMSQRQNHYMSAGMLPSQFLALEPPHAESGVTVLDVSQELAVLVEVALARVGGRQVVG
jgi:gluconokinase